MEELPTFKCYIWNEDAVMGCCVGFVSKAFQAMYGDLRDGRVVDARILYWEKTMKQICADP